MPRTSTTRPCAPSLAKLAAKILAERKTSKSAPFDAYRDDPAAFAREILGVRLWAKQLDILEAVRVSQRVAVRSGHKIGKSTSAVVLAIWFACTRPRARVVLTSSTDRQVRLILWKELRRIYSPVARRLGGDLHLDPATGLQWPDGREIVGFTAKDPEKMAGISGPAVLFVVDEASGVPEEIFEAIEGNRAGGASIALFSNPTQTSGTFFDAFNTKREFWRSLHVSSEETPNVTGVGDAVPGLATKAWVAEKRAEWGTESPLYQVRVRGNFPSQAENAVVGLGIVEAARARWADTPAAGRLDIGVDVARFGDDESVMVARRGAKVIRILAVQGLDGIQVAGRVMQLVTELGAAGEEKPRVKVDVIGVGASVVDQLRQHRDRIELAEVNVSERASAEGFANTRSQIWFATRDWLKEGGALPEDARLEAELVAPVYAFDAQGRAKVEPKDDIKKRLGRSPDRADALGLAIWNDPRAAVPTFSLTAAQRAAMPKARRI